MRVGLAPLLSRPALALLGLIGLCALAISGSAHEEDWRKLRDRLPPYAGPSLTGQPLSPDESGMLRGPGGSAFPAQGIQLLSHLTLGTLGGGQNGNDCWGYVSPSGREYAIMGSFNGTHFVEVTDPVNPVIVGFIDGNDSLWRDIAVRGHYAYMASEAGNSGVQIVDMSNIDAATNRLRYVGARLVGGHTRTHTLIANEDDPTSPYLYVCGSNLGGGALLVMSLADPENPVIVGQWTEPGARYAHEAVVVSYPNGLPGLPGPREIAYSFYIYGNGGVDILDVTNKANIHRIATGSYPNMKGPHQGWLSEDKTYLYINDELDETIGAPASVTRVLNVSNPSNPIYVGSFASGRPSVDHNLYVKDGMIFESNYRSGLRVFDASTNPLSPTQVAYIDTFAADDAPNYNGNWGNFPFFPSGTIILSDLEQGLIVIRLQLGYVTFEYPNGRPATITPGAPTPLRVRVQAPQEGAVDAASVELHVSVNGGPFTATPMTDVGGGVFQGDLPAAACLSTVDYYVTARNTLSTAIYSDPVTAPASTYETTVASSIVTVFADDMEIDRGWTVGAPTDTATLGIWNRMDPQPTPAQPGDDHTPAPGTICWVTDGNAGTGSGAFDVDGGGTTLTSPVLNLAGTNEARVGYWRWYSNSAGGAPNQDTFVVWVSNNDGSTWTLAETVGPFQDAGGGWVYHELRVADFVTPTSTVRLRFRAADFGAGSLVEAALDDFVVLDLRCDVPCPADFDDDGLVTTADITAFLSAWFADLATGTLNANFNGDAVVNSADISAFLGAWFAALQVGGC
ncbi:MAG TPA: choice-of-anchor B family protein [Phycisphaerales bacterium]|nr:choice-of-anchor B family protein [Phycisphaerales bacterium]